MRYALIAIAAVVGYAYLISNDDAIEVCEHSFSHEMCVHMIR